MRLESGSISGRTGMSRGALCALCWWLVAFYLVASCRGFVPNICATLSAANANQEGVACDVRAGGTPSCCAPNALEDTTRDANSERPSPAPQDGHCPFCTLVTSPSPAPCTVSLPVPVAPTHAAPIPVRMDAPRVHVPTTFQNRAPPA